MESADRFAFGKNWQDCLGDYRPERLDSGAVDVTTSAALTGAALTATDNLRWGYHGSSGDPWVGSQDQTAVFNGELTATEVTYLYNSGNGISYATLKAAAGF